MFKIVATILVLGQAEPETLSYKGTFADREACEAHMTVATVSLVALLRALPVKVGKVDVACVAVEKGA